MKTTLLFAIVTAALNQIGVSHLAELTHFITASLALMQGGPAIALAVARGRGVPAEAQRSVVVASSISGAATRLIRSSTVYNRGWSDAIPSSNS